MTFFHTREGWLILGTIKDLCTKEIVAWDFDTGATVELALKTLKQIRFYGGSLLHSDQGGTYTSPAYRDEAEKLGITLSYSRKGNCYDNASMEKFLWTLKIRDHLPDAIPSAIRLNTKRTHSNHQRLHSVV